MSEPFPAGTTAGPGGKSPAGARSGKGPCGLVLFDKPRGVTTFSLVREARKALGIRQAGHVGTLDPLATGLAGVLVGPAVKLSGLIMGCAKVYSGEMRLGLATDTDDVTGETLSEHTGPYPELPLVREALEAFLGERPQRPPVFSAVKVGGRPSYAAARRGEAAAPLAERPALMINCRILGWVPPLLSFRIEVGSGFYVRSLARDLGLALGLGGGALASLRRERLGSFDLSRAVPPPFTGAAMLASLLGPREALPEIPEFPLVPREADALRAGRILAGPEVGPGRMARLPGRPEWAAPRGGYPAGTVLATLEGRPVALAEYAGPGGPPAAPLPPEGAEPGGAVGNGGRAFSPPRGPFLRPLRVFPGP
ncbi:MAG: tRNA pseudouridine(55) synthase TruB [Deltaproteobacteria bacterium]|nr:tRNA pseudouridine(55) synthase TruB [Deltaproteobacteria bacterium]